MNTTSTSEHPVTTVLSPEDIDLSVDLGPLKLENPIMTASGTAGLGLEMEPFYDLADAGADKFNGCLVFLLNCGDDLFERFDQSNGFAILHTKDRTGRTFAIENGPLAVVD